MGYFSPDINSDSMNTRLFDQSLYSKKEEPNQDLCSINERVTKTSEIKRRKRHKNSSGPYQFGLPFEYLQPDQPLSHLTGDFPKIYLQARIDMLSPPKTPKNRSRPCRIVQHPNYEPVILDSPRVPERKDTSTQCRENTIVCAGEVQFIPDVDFFDGLNE